MHFDELMTERAVLAELGRRLATHRRERNLTQAEAAAQAGIGQATLQRIERGESVQMRSMVKLLRALDLLGGLDVAVPESIELPIARLERERREPPRRRVRHGRRGRARRSTGPADDRAQSEVRSEGRADDRAQSEVRSEGPADDRAQPEVRSEWASDDRAQPEEHLPAPESAQRPWRWGDESDAP